MCLFVCLFVCAEECQRDIYSMVGEEVVVGWNAEEDKGS
jgi:uncharacterized protein YuzB (UPF0349 family)